MKKSHFAFFPNVTFYSVNQQMTFSLKQLTLLTSLEFVNVCNVELAREVIFVKRYLYEEILILFIFVSPLLTLELCKFEESVVQLLVFLSKRLQVV